MPEGSRSPESPPPQTQGSIQRSPEISPAGTAILEPQLPQQLPHPGERVPGQSLENIVRSNTLIPEAPDLGGQTSAKDRQELLMGEFTEHKADKQGEDKIPETKGAGWNPFRRDDNPLVPSGPVQTGAVERSTERDADATPETGAGGSVLGNSSDEGGGSSGGGRGGDGSQPPEDGDGNTSGEEDGEPEGDDSQPQELSPVPIISETPLNTGTLEILPTAPPTTSEVRRIEIADIDTSRWTVDQRESLEMLKRLSLDTRDGSRMIIQCAYSLPVEAWKTTEVKELLGRAVVSYKSHIRGVPELKLSHPDIADELLETESQLDNLRLSQAESGVLGGEDQNRLNSLKEKYRKLRAQEKEFQRQVAAAQTVASILREVVEAQDEEKREEQEREAKLDEARRDEVIELFFARTREEQEKAPTERRTYSKVMEDIRKYIEPGGTEHNDYLRYQGLQEMVVELELLERLAAEDPRFIPVRDETRRAYSSPDNEQLRGRIEVLFQERELYLLAAKALGVTSAVEGRVEGYYQEHRADFSTGDPKDFGALKRDIMVLIDPQSQSRALSQALSKERLLGMFGTNALGIQAQALQNLFEGVTEDFAKEAIVELQVQASRFKQAREKDQPLLSIDFASSTTAGLFSAQRLEEQLRRESRESIRRRNVEARTGIKVDESVEDRDIRLWGRNDYNYIMLHSTSKGELVEALSDYVLYRTSAESRWDVQEILGDIQRIVQLVPLFQIPFGMKAEEVQRLIYETDGMLYALVGDHFDRVADPDTLGKVGEAFCNTYGAERLEYTYQAGKGLRAWIIDQKQNNPRYQLFEQLDLYQGEFHAKNHEQRQLYFDLIDSLAYESIGVRLKVPSLNQRKLGLDVPRADFRGLYYEDIYSGKYTNQVVKVVAKKKEKGIPVSDEERHILDYGEALKNGRVYLEKLSKGEVRKDANPQERLFWVGFIQQKMVKALPLTAHEKDVKAWFFDPEFGKAKAEVALGLSFESFTGEASMRTSCSYQSENGDFVPNNRILAFMHTARSALEDKLLAGKKFKTTADKLKIIYESRDKLEECWDFALEAVARKGFEARIQVGNEVITLESAWKDPRGLIIADTYVSTEQITRGVLNDKSTSLDALTEGFMYRLEADLETREREIVGLEPDAAIRGNPKLVKLDNVREGAGIFSRNRWLLDPQGKILVSKEGDNISEEEIESEIMLMGDYSTRKHYFAKRRAMRKLGYRPAKEARKRASDLFKDGDVNQEMVVSANFSSEQRGKKEDYAIYKIDERGRYVCVEGFARGYDGKPVNIANKIFERQFTGYFVEVSPLEQEGDDFADKNYQRIVLRPSDAKKAPYNIGLVPKMDDQVRLGDENISAGLARKRLTEMPHYFRMKQNRFPRFKEITEVAPSMLMPDSRFHGALDTRGGIAVVKRESELQRAVENKGEDFIIQEIVNFGMPVAQARVYKKIIGGIIDGKIITPEAAKPTADGVQFGKGEAVGRDISSIENAIQWAALYRARMERPEGISDELYDAYTDKRFGFGSGLGRLIQSLWIQDNFDLLVTMGTERDYPDQKEWIDFLHNTYHIPVGNMRDFLMGQMTKGKSTHQTYKVSMPTRNRDIPGSPTSSQYSRILEI